MGNSNCKKPRVQFQICLTTNTTKIFLEENIITHVFVQRIIYLKVCAKNKNLQQKRTKSQLLFKKIHGEENTHLYELESKYTILQKSSTNTTNFNKNKKHYLDNAIVTYTNMFVFVFCRYSFH